MLGCKLIAHSSAFELNDTCMQMVKLWREDLGKVNQKAAEALADPAQYKNLFPNMDAALQAEQHQVGLHKSPLGHLLQGFNDF